MFKVLEQSIRSITSDWSKAKRHADRQNRVRWADLNRMRSGRTQESIKDAANDVMEKAYLHASANGTLPANARQVMYAARPLVLDITGGRCWKNSSYFTQHLLPEFMEENAEAASWDIIFDARGRLREPHTQKEVPLGTLEVRGYIGKWVDDGLADDNGDLEELLIDAQVRTCGPGARYKFALFIEKEGFNELLKRSSIAERYDIAIMSTKGMSVTAARQLVEELSAQDVTILVAHDFDKSGFRILNTLRSDTRRYSFSTEPKVVDIGLRLDDIKAMNLPAEQVYYNNRRISPENNLSDSGATGEEIAFLVGRGTSGQRVELNAMASDVFIRWLEGKLKAAGVEKVVPAADVLERAYRRAVKLRKIINVLEEASEEDLKIKVPKGLVKKVQRAIRGKTQSWDQEIWDMAEDHAES